MLNSFGALESLVDILTQNLLLSFYEQLQSMLVTA